MKRFRSPFFFLLIALVRPGMAWESQLLPFNAGAGEYQEATVNFNSRNWRLLDFSYTGYKLGNQALASGVPCNIFNVSASGDITTALQSAITSAQAAGGVVRIPAGTFTLSAPLYITASNVSIEGAGSNATFINVPASYTQSDPRYEGLFTFGKAAAGWNKGWIDRGTVITDVTAVVPEGQMYVDVLDASAINVNDFIVVRQYFWPTLSNNNSNNTWASYTGWPSPTTGGNRSFSFTYIRQVLSKAGLRLNLDAPIPWRLDPANNPVKIQLVPPTGGFAMKTNVGLSGLSITFADNFNDTSYTPARPAGAAVHFEGVRDGWAYDVVVRNFPRFAFQGESAARITILKCAVYDCQDDGGDGFGYGYHWNESQQILVKQCYAEKVRHAYLSQHPLSNFVVFTQNTSREARLGDDSHHSFVHGYLFDNHQSFEGSGARMVERGSTSSNAYECLGSGVFWNFQGDGGRGGGADGGSIHMNPSFSGWGMVIGGPGGAFKVFDGNTNAGDLIAPAAGLQVGPTLQAAAEGSKDQNTLYEGIGQAALSPASLYGTQLLRRLGSQPAEFTAGCSSNFNLAALQPSLFAGPGTLVYNSDQLGWVPALGSSGCDPSSTSAGGTKTLQCWADSSARDHTTGSGESALITLTGTDYNVQMDFIGTTQPRNSFANLTFWAYASAAGMQFRVYVAQRQDGNYTDVNAANTIVTIPTANAWTQISIPMSTFGTGATLFNKIQIRSYSTNAGATVYLDDIVLTGGSTPTPTETPTLAAATPTATPSFTRSATGTATLTPTPTRSATPSFTALASTATATITASGSPTRSASPTATSTGSPTATPSATPSFSRTPTSTQSNSPSASATPSLTPTFTDVPAGSTATATHTASASQSPTFSDSASPSPTASAAASLSSTPTVTTSGTVSLSASLSPTESGTPSVSPTYTSGMPSSTATATSTAIATGTASFTRTAVLTVTSTSSSSMTTTLTSTLTNSATSTALSSPSMTASPTLTSSPSSTMSPTAGPTPAMGSSEIIFDSDNSSYWQTGTVVNVNLNSAAMNHTAAGSEAGSAFWSAGGHLDFYTDYVRDWADFDYVEFWIYPTSSSLSLSHFLEDASGPYTGYLTIDAAYVGGWRLNEWNRVLVPKSAYATPLTQVRVWHLLPPGFASDFFLDDVRLVKGPMPTNTPTVSPTPAVTPVDDGQAVLAVAGLPNPQFGPTLNLQIQVQRGVDKVSVSAFSPGYNLIWRQNLPVAPGGGWKALSLPAAGLPSGLIFIEVKGASGEPKVAKVARWP